MSGYKNMWFSTQEEHQAYIAFAEYSGLEPDSEGALNEWNSCPMPPGIAGSRRPK